MIEFLSFALPLHSKHISGFKKSHVTWQGTHCEFMKLMTSASVTCLDLNIHKSNEVVAVTHESKVGITYCSMVLATNERMACFTIYSHFGNTICGIYRMTEHLNH
jgi:hypothetical protein